MRQAEPMQWRMDQLAREGLSGWREKPRRGLSYIMSPEHLHISWLTSTSASLTPYPDLQLMLSGPLSILVSLLPQALAQLNS